VLVHRLATVAAPVAIGLPQAFVPLGYLLAVRAVAVVVPHIRLSRVDGVVRSGLLRHASPLHYALPRGARVIGTVLVGGSL
jgi:hypothetical protein